MTAGGLVNKAVILTMISSSGRRRHLTAIAPAKSQLADEFIVRRRMFFSGTSVSRQSVTILTVRYVSSEPIGGTVGVVHSAAE